MGASKNTTNNQTSSTTQSTPPGYVNDLNQAQAQAQQSLIPGQTKLQQTGIDAAQNIYNAFANNTPLTGYLGQLQGVTPEDQQSIVNQSLRDIYPQFQGGGILNSGAAASIAARTASDLRGQFAQFNVGALQNLLNLVNTGQAQVQQPINAQSAVLSSRLNGLNTTTTQGAGNTATYGQNPFVNSFETSAGGTLGSPRFQGQGIFSPFSFGG